MPCQGDEIKPLETRLNIRDLECGMAIFTTFPALRHVCFELDGISFGVTVELPDAAILRPAAHKD